MPNKCLGKLELLIFRSVLFVNNLIFFFLFCNNFLIVLLILLILDNETNVRRPCGLFLPPLYFIIINDCIAFVSSNLVALISQQKDVTQMLSVGLKMGQFLQSIDKTWYGLKLWLFGFAVMMG